MEIKSKPKYGFMFDTKRFLIIAVCLLIIFLVIMVFFWVYIEEVSNSPCAVCAKRLGETVTCGSPQYSNIIMYHSNLSIEEKNFPSEDSPGKGYDIKVT